MTIARYTLEEAKKLRRKSDLVRLHNMKDKDIDYSDIPALTTKELKQFSRVGRPIKLDPKQQINLRLDADVIKAFQSGGPGWQTRINDALRHVIKLGSLV